MIDGKIQAYRYYVIQIINELLLLQLATNFEIQQEDDHVLFLPVVGKTLSLYDLEYLSIFQVCLFWTEPMMLIGCERGVAS